MTARIETSGRAHGHALVPLRYAVAILAVLAAFSLLPLGGPLVLAAWTATLLEPWTARVAARLGGRGRAAAALTTLVVVVLLTPLVVTGAALAAAVAEAATKLRDTRQASDLLGLVSPPGLGASFEHLSPQRLVELARRHGGGAIQAAQTALGALTAAAIAVVVYVLGVFEGVAHGPRAVRWLRDRALVSRSSFSRLSGAFVETGRGLFIGIGGTSLLQAVVATIGYAVVGVPQPLLLGFVTLIASLIPSVGTALVWVPVTVLLFVSGRTAAGVAMALVGSATSVVDNFVRPWLSHYGTLRLPTFVTFVAMLGGIIAFGGFGLFLGPLFVRLGVEALDIWREQRRPRA